MAEQQLIDLLVSNGVGGQNSKAALGQLDAFKQDPGFVAVVCTLVKSPTCPVDPSTLTPMSQQCDWGLVRDVAAWLLKTCIRPGMAFPAMAAAAEASLAILREAGVQRRLVSAAAVVIARLTDLNGVPWWEQNGLDLSTLLLQEMLPAEDTDKATSALRCLQYLVEDAAASMGASISVIVERVADTAQNRGDATLRSMAFNVLVAVYEFGSELDWKVENLSDVQQALCNGAGSAAVAAATGLSLGFGAYDEETTAKLYRLIELLLDYLPNLASSAACGGTLDQIFGAWAHAGITGISPEVPPEVAGFACSFVGSAFTNFDNSGGDGPIVGLCSLLIQSTEGIVDSLLHNIIMKAEEEDDMMTSDGFDVRDPHQRRRPVKRRGAAAAGSPGGDRDDGARGGADDAESAEASLRNFACLTLEAIATVEPDRVSARVINNVQHVFTGHESDWHKIECAICALGCIYTGAQQQLNPFLPNLVPMIGQAVGNGEPAPAHHIATISIALWALSKFSEWAMMHDATVFDQIVGCAMPCLTSSSKRVQFAAITFFRNTLLLCMSVDPQGGGPISKHLPTLAEKVNVCLPVYHTRNLKLLCTIGKALIPIMGPVAATLIEPFSNQLQARLPLLQQSMAQRYQHDDVRVQPDCDCFEIGGVTASVYAALDLTPEIAHRASGELTTWIQVVKFALECEAQSDDTTPFYGSLENMTMLIAAVDDESLTAILSASDGEFVRLLLHVATNVEDPEVKSSACNLLYELLGRFGPEVLGTSGPDGVVATIATFGTAADNCSLISDAALLLLKLFEVIPPAATENAQRFATVLAKQVRGDALDNDAMGMLAQCVGAMMQATPQHYDLRSAAETAMALRRSENDQYKSDATFGVIAVVSAHASGNDAAGLGDAMQAFIRLILSWQRDAGNFEGLGQGIAAFLANAKQHQAMSQALYATVNERFMPKAAMQMLQTLYSI